MGVAALVFGILGLVTCWVPFVGILLGLIGLILGIVSMIKKSGNKAFGLIGIVVGGIGMIICVVITILAFVVGDAVIDAVDEHQLQDNPAGLIPFNQ